MRRMYAYLLKHRFLDREVVNAFVRAGLLYESCEKFNGRELRQLSEPRSDAELVDELRRSILPHQNRSNWKNRTAELAAQVEGVLKKVTAPGIRSKTEKRELADGWLELAVSFVKVPVKYEADILKQQQKQVQAIPKLEMG